MDKIKLEEMIQKISNILKFNSFEYEKDKNFSVINKEAILLKIAEVIAEDYYEDERNTQKHIFEMTKILG